MHALTLVSLGLCAALAAPLAQAQATEPPARGPIPFPAYDKDKSGTISKQEFESVRGERIGQRAEEGRPMRGLANAPSFESFDTDGNGQLTEAELNAGQRAQMQQRPGLAQGPGAGAGRGPGQGPGAGQGRAPGQGGAGPGAGAGRNMPGFADFDLNSDGVMTRAEFQEAHAKRVQERQQQGGQLRNQPAAPDFAQMDMNGDGSVTAEEFATHQNQQRARKPR